MSETDYTRVIWGVKNVVGCHNMPAPLPAQWFTPSLAPSASLQQTTGRAYYTM